MASGIPKPTGPPYASRFETTVMIHLDAAYGLAWSLTRDERNAEDIVQEACLRAFRFLDTFRGGNSRAWFLSIVRNTYYSELKKNRSQALNVPLDENDTSVDESSNPFCADDDSDPFRDLEREEAKRIVRAALVALPDEYREVMVLRELDEFSYQDIARITQVPLGTVMSRLSRARKLLYRALQRVKADLIQ
jgi:RNA polymerase sigma factor (sigma-70 family)